MVNIMEEVYYTIKKLGKLNIMDISKKEIMMDLEKNIIMMIIEFILDFLVIINIMEKVLYIKRKKNI